MKRMKEKKNLKLKVGIARATESMEAKSVGSLHFGSCILKKVIYVPDLSANLMSVNAITDRGGEILFTKTGVQIKQRGNTEMSGEKIRSGLYGIILEDKNTKTTYSAREDNTGKEWHKRLGHLA